ncbi:MAG: sugar phosphate isomerase/epimerase [Chloroflexi bacterium]|nr:sugar phosphate isomerase/epimerase [Chloroflexota bacterium]
MINLPQAKLGCHPIAWRGVALGDVLREIAETGYEGAEGGTAYLDQPEIYRQMLASNDLKEASAYAGGAYYDPARAPAAIEQAHCLAQFVKMLGGDVLCVACNGNEQRRQSPGFYPDGNRPDGLDEDGWRVFADSMKRLGEACLAIGVRAAFHNHIGTFVETRDELDELMRRVEPELLGLAPDTGHLFYGGADPVAVYRDYAPRIRYMHFKDANAEAIERARRERMTQGQCMEIGGFCELGRGAIDLEACLAALEPVDYAGWIMVEQDRSLIGPLQSARVSRAWLRERMGR